MNQEQLDRFYLIYVLAVTILILAFAWIVFESQYIYGQQNVFAVETQEYCLPPDNSLPNTAKEIINITKRKIQYYNEFQKGTALIEQV